MTLASGSRLGSYEILSPLGAGGMGEVVRARDTRLGREVAIKVLPSDVASQPDRVARLEREAKTVAALNHPNIVTLHSIEEEDGIRFLTMELVEGHGLDRLVAPGGLPVARVLDLAIPLADALAAAHERGVVHRDLKPANVMVTREGRVKVLDFGLSKAVPAAWAPEATQALTMEAPISVAGQVVGTAPYMAPEQVRADAVDARTDLFALGVILYELVTGRRPFGGATSADVISAILRDAPAPAQSLRGDLPADLGRIIGRCLEKDPERRFQTAKDVRNELELIRRAAESSVSVAAPVSSPSHVGSLPPASAVQEVPSIAVLPFVNRSRDEEDEYFSDGLADELMNVLAKIRGLRVAARTSSYHFKGKQEDVSIIGAKLNVATLLEGTVRKAGNRVRISVQLVKVADGYQLWSETYDRTLDDIFAVQDDIAQSVVKELRAALMGEDPDSKSSGEVRAAVREAAKGRADDPEAHRLLLHGRYFLERFTPEDVARGIGYLLQAVSLDPDYALAWVDLSRAYNVQAGYGWVSLEEGVAQAKAAVERAIALEPDLPEGHLALGMIQSTHDWDWIAAEESFQRAMDLASGRGSGLRGAGSLALGVGRLDDAVALCRRAAEDDPLSASAFSSLGNTCRYAGLLADSRAALVKSLELAPQRIVTNAILGLTLLEEGRPDEALAAIEREPAAVHRLASLAAVLHTAGRRPESDAALRELTERFGEDGAYQIAAAHAWRGEADDAFAWLERGRAQRDPGLAHLRIEPVFRPLHRDPRWLPFMRAMGFAV